jgi:ketopantoate reductase
MKIAIVGPGPIGSPFAFHLARAGHDVTVVARGARLAYLEKERAIVTTMQQRAPVEVSATLESTHHPTFLGVSFWLTSRISNPLTPSRVMIDPLARAALA